MQSFIVSYSSENFDYFTAAKSVPDAVYDDPTVTENRKEEVHKQAHSCMPTNT